MCPHTPDKIEPPLNRPVKQPGKQKKPKIKAVSKPTTPLTPPPAQSPRVQVMQNTTHSSPRVDIIPPTETKNTTKNDTDDTDKLIAHFTRARRPTPWTWDTPSPAILTQLTHKPVAKQTRLQINPKGIDQQVGISTRQASQRRSPHTFIHKWAMPIMDTVTGETLEHRQL